jgi:hypothetical protein
VVCPCLGSAEETLVERTYEWDCHTCKGSGRFTCADGDDVHFKARNEHDRYREQHRITGCRRMTPRFMEVFGSVGSREASPGE